MGSKISVCERALCCLFISFYGVLPICMFVCESVGSCDAQICADHFEAKAFSKGVWKQCIEPANPIQATNAHAPRDIHGSIVGSQCNASIQCGNACIAMADSWQILRFPSASKKEISARNDGELR